MRRSSTRRKFLATLGTTTTLSLAGCSAILGPSDGGGSQTPSTTDSAGTDTNTKSNGTPQGTKNGKDGGKGTPQQKKSGPFSRGTVVEDFEGKLASWSALAGKVTIDRKNPYQGSQSLVLRSGTTGKKGGENTNSSANTTQTTTTTKTQTSKRQSAGVARSYYSSSGKSKALDLRKHDLTMAVRFEKPANGSVDVELLAPTKTISLSSGHFVPKELNGWTRFDFGYTGEEGNPVLKEIYGIRILVTTDKGPIDVAIDDIRKIPKAKKGKVMFQFDDGTLTTYTKAFPELEKRGWKAGAAIIPDAIGTPKNMTWANVREMGSAGWDMMSHPPVANPLPTYSAKKQEQVIRGTKKTLELKGFKRGARHIVAPYGRVSNKTIEIMKKYHDANYMFGACPGNAKHPSNMYGISRLYGDADAADLSSLIDLAEKYRQMVVIGYHDIGTGTGTSTSMADFKKILTHVEKKNMDVVSPSQFLDSIKK
jgi:peptidoglycan/xylan/chitin deacetylase (PgdA/CDA1 family)